MAQKITISAQEIIQHLKLSCQIPSILEAIAIRNIIHNAAKNANLTVEVEELQQAADQLRLANQLLQANETWKWLQKYCLTLDEFEEIAYTNALSTKLAEYLFRDRVESFFVEHYLEYAVAILYEVVLDDEDLAIELFYALQEEEITFYEVAQQYAEAIETRRTGGFRGQVSRQELRPEISAAVFAANAPQLLKPIVTPLGVHLIHVEEIVEPELGQPLRVKILSDLFSDWLTQQVKQLELIPNLDHNPVRESVNKSVAISG